MIYEIKQYIDDDGRQVTEKVSLKTEETQLIGSFQVPHPTQGQATIGIDFPEDYDIEKCFEEFDELAKTEYDKYVAHIQELMREQQEAEQSRIITPDEIRNTGGFELI